ncbi:MAG: ABC transporter ATP-binding protein [Chloroflexi bacterium]|nr:ABC transporter ATP-binding protein [Chloroflexota bacterium]
MGVHGRSGERTTVPRLPVDDDAGIEPDHGEVDTGRELAPEPRGRHRHGARVVPAQHRPGADGRARQAVGQQPHVQRHEAEARDRRDDLRLPLCRDTAGAGGGQALRADNAAHHARVVVPAVREGGEPHLEHVGAARRRHVLGLGRVLQPGHADVRRVEGAVEGVPGLLLVRPQDVREARRTAEHVAAGPRTDEERELVRHPRAVRAGQRGAGEHGPHRRPHCRAPGDDRRGDHQGAQAVHQGRYRARGRGRRAAGRVGAGGLRVDLLRRVRAAGGQLLEGRAAAGRAVRGRGCVIGESVSSTERNAGNVVLDVQELQTHLFTKWGVTRAVDGVSFQIREGETLGLVGESGSGKSMTALSLLRLLPEAARIVGGCILLDGDDIVRMRMPDVREMRGRKISMILQDPQTALNPVFTIGNQLTESIAARSGRNGGRRSKQSVRDRAMEVLRMMRVAAPERRLSDFPHQMSGGMKQRVVGGIAIESQPRLLIADEPTTALDVTIQAQYLNLLKEIQRETGVAILFITHDLGVVARMCDRVAVMYAGRIVEQGGIHEIFDKPSHPYTQALLGSIPKMEERVDRLTVIEGQPPALFALPQGCRFAVRCPHVHDRCEEAYPAEFTGSDGHTAACWLLEEKWKPTSS